MTTKLDEQTVSQTRAILFNQTEAVRGFIDVVGWSSEDVSSYASMLRDYLMAQGRDREELRISLLEMLDPEGAIKLDTVPLEVDSRNDTGIAAARQSLDEKKARFGKKLTGLMAEAGLSQQELAEKLGVTQSCISQFASGNHKPQPDTLRKLADALDCEIADLWP